MNRRAERIRDSKDTPQALKELDFLLNPTCTAALLRLTLPELGNLREKGQGPRWIEAGSRIRYRFSDLQAWLSREVPPTEEIKADLQHDAGA